jgi:tellurite methyltransferase
MKTLNTDDKNYWGDFYKNKKAPDNASMFAQEVLLRLSSTEINLIEFGFGNGRDLKYFQRNGINADGIDLATDSAKILECEKAGCFVIEGSFADKNVLVDKNEHYDVVYSRFTLHSVDDELEKLSLENAYRLLKPGGAIAIEARSIYDDFNGRGEKISENEWIYEDHYRRFINPAAIVQNLQDANFIVRSFEISDTFAVYKDQRPECIRIFAVKN